MGADSSAYRRALKELAAVFPAHWLQDEPLARHTSWRIGGPADLFLEPDCCDQIAPLVQAVRAAGLPLVVLGSGSNLLCSDAGVRGVVLKIGSRLSRFLVSGTRITAGAGLWVPRLARLAARAGVSGFEPVAGIPGTLGGLLVMNGGSQRKAIGDSLVRAWGVGAAGEALSFTREECGFAYRQSSFQRNRVILLGMELQGVAGDPRGMRREMLGILRDRRGKFPLKEPNCGSVFLSDPEHYNSIGPPGKIIEAAGLKGTRVGGVQVSSKHANFIVNTGRGTAAQVLELVSLVQDTVQERTGARLESEALFLSQEGATISLSAAARSRHDLQ
jgi:UDP-N-acetylmuramate dehydrogenase